MKCGGIISCCALAIVLLSVMTATNGALPASLDVETSITTKGDFGVVTKSESVTILAIFRANRFTIQRSVKAIDNILYVETRGTAFRSIHMINELQYGVLRSVSGSNGVRRFRALRKLFPALETKIISPANSTNQPWTSVVQPANPEWREMKMSLHGFGADISFLQPCTDVPYLCYNELDSS